MLHAAVSLALVMLVVGLVLAAVLVPLLAHVIFRPPRMTDGKAVYRLNRLSPGDLGLRFEDQPATVRDGRSGRPLRLAGWWIPAGMASTRTAVVVHGYADAKVGSIAWAPLLHGLGMNLYVADLRAHGESGGRLCTGGQFEADDVRQAIADLRAARPDQTRVVVLFGVSMGAAVAAGVAAVDHDVAGVILESPFADYRRAVRAHARLVGLPDGWVLTAALWLGERVAGCRLATVRPPDLIGRSACPALVVLGGLDPMLDPSDVAAITAAVDRHATRHPASRTWLVPNAGHLNALHVRPAEYRRHVADFLHAAGLDGDDR